MEETTPTPRSKNTKLGLVSETDIRVFAAWYRRRRRSSTRTVLLLHRVFVRVVTYLVRILVSQVSSF